MNNPSSIGNNLQVVSGDLDMEVLVTSIIKLKKSVRKLNSTIIRWHKVHPIHTSETPVKFNSVQLWRASILNRVEIKPPISVNIFLISRPLKTGRQQISFPRQPNQAQFSCVKCQVLIFKRLRSIYPVRDYSLTTHYLLLQPIPTFGPPCKMVIESKHRISRLKKVSQ